MTRYYSATAQDTQLSSNISSGSTSITVAALIGFPSSFPYTVAIDYGNTSEELVDVTGASGLTLTVTRAVNGTTAVSHSVGATIRHVITARDLTEVQAHYAAGPGGVHGITGALNNFLSTPSSANLASAVSDETGTGPLVFSNSPTLVTPTLGTPASVTLTNGTGLPVSTGISGLGTGVATFLATPTSANLASVVTDETGSGSLVFGSGPVVNTAVATPTFSTNAYALVLSDASKVLLTSNGSTAGTVTIPTNASVAFPVGTTITVIQTGSGQLTVQGASGVTLASIGATSTAPKLRIQNSPVTLVQTSANTWYAIGDIV